MTPNRAPWVPADWIALEGISGTPITLRADAVVGMHGHRASGASVWVAGAPQPFVVKQTCEEVHGLLAVAIASMAVTLESTEGVESYTGLVEIPGTAPSEQMVALTEQHECWQTGCENRFRRIAVGEIVPVADGKPICPKCRQPLLSESDQPF